MADKTEAQPEALYVAEQLDATRHAFGDDNAQSKRRASAELRRLHAEIQQLKAQLTTQTNRAAAAEQQVTALTQRLDMANRLNTDARNQLAQLSARQAAPDGWEPVWAVFRTRPDENDGKEFLHSAMWHNDTILSEGERYVQGHFVPGAAPPPPEREPLTLAEIDGIGDATGKPSFTWHYEFARAIERAHGIGATND